MQLRNQVEWALHCCAVLAGQPPDRYIATKVLAEFHGVPKEYLSKALQNLSQAGIIEGTLGPSGGYRLAKSPEDISFLDIVQAVEGRSSTFVCTNIRDNNPCRTADTCDSHPCEIARIMWEADEAWRTKLRAVRLADLLATLRTDIPADQHQRTAAWFRERS